MLKAKLSLEPLRVVVYTDSEGVGGAEISLSHLVAEVIHSQEDRAIELTVVGVSEAVINRIVANSGVRHFVLPSRGIRAFIAHFLTLNRLRPDIIHFNCCTPWSNAIGLFVAFFLPAKIVRVDQLPLRTTDAVTLWRTRALCLRVDAAVAVGVASARRMEDFYALGRNSVISIPNGVPVLPAECKVHSPLVVGSIGRLDAMKAHDLLLQAIAQVDQIQLVILGEGGQRSALEQLAIELGISDRVHLKGWVANPRDYLADFDWVALPSRSEGFPLAMVEAMLAGLPVIATRVGSMPEAIIAGKTGLLIEKDDVDGLVQALIKLRDQPELRLQLGRQARQAALENWTVAAMTAKYKHLWYELMGTPAQSRWWVPRPRD